MHDDFLLLIKLSVSVIIVIYSFYKAGDEGTLVPVIILVCVMSGYYYGHNNIWRKLSTEEAALLTSLKNDFPQYREISNETSLESMSVWRFRQILSEYNEYTNALGVKARDLDYRRSLEEMQSLLKSKSHKELMSNAEAYYSKLDTLHRVEPHLTENDK